MSSDSLFKKLQMAPHAEKFILKDDERIHQFERDIVYSGKPDAVYRAASPQEIGEILNYAHAQHLPVTFCGSQTSLTGSSVADSGLIIALSKMNAILDIDEKNHLAIAQPGILLADFQDQLANKNYFYPPDPTSRWEAQLGASVATNATGEDSLLYGSTRCHIHALKIIHANGTEKIYQRSGKFIPNKEKGRAGYFLPGESIDHFIGSEGSLGFISEITVKLIPNPQDFFAGIVFFPNLTSALNAVIQIQSQSSIKARCLELIDRAALDIIATHPESFYIPPQAGCALYFKQEYRDEKQKAQLQETWFKILDELLHQAQASSLLNDTVIAEDPSKKTLLRKLRHHIPSVINERANHYAKNGGGKVTTDWWVPLKHLNQAINHALQLNQQLAAEFSLFGHIGNGHPHLEYLVKSSAEKINVEQVILSQYQLAAKLGGGVAAEHGVGKIKRHLLPVQCSAAEIQQIHALKNHYDPHWILGQNNILTPPPAP